MQNVLIYVALIGIMMQAGCVLVDHQPSTVPEGSSVRLAVRQQTLNPDAGGDAPVVGIDGRYAASVFRQYQEGPKTDPNDGQSVSEVIIEAR